jgi:DNA-directed RNA polymerase specialized sigma24 family protein
MTYTQDETATHRLTEDCRTVRGDRSWNTLHDWLRDFAAVYVLDNGGRAEDADELTNDILLTAWDKPRPTKPRRYLMQAVRNRWVDRVRAASGEGKWISDYSGGGVSFVEFGTN